MRFSVDRLASRVPLKKKKEFFSLISADLIVFPSLFLALRFLANSTLNYYYPGFWRSVPTEGYTSWFLSDVPIGPGKFSFWLASLLSPYFADPTLGALIITVMAYILRMLTERVMKEFGIQKLLGFVYLPVLIMFFQFYYLINPLPQAIAMMAALCALQLYSYAINARFYRIAAFLALACLVLIIGGGSFLVFSALAVTYDVYVKRHIFIAALNLIIAALVPAIMTLLFYPLNSLSDTYGLFAPIFPLVPSIISILPLIWWIFFAGFPILALIEKLLVDFGDKVNKIYIRTFLLSSSKAHHGIFLGMVVCVSAILIVRLDHEPLTQARSNAVLNLGMVQGAWSAVLEESKKIPRRYLTDSKIHVIDRALFHQGRLLEDLFDFPQNQNALLLFPYSGTARTLGPSDRFWTSVWAGHTYFELGMVNTAEHCALEAISQFYYPEGLRLLSNIYAVKEMPEARLICLRALRKDCGYKAWADACFKVPNPGENSILEAEASPARSNAITERFMESGTPPLSLLVKEHPKNRIAFEYLVASFLIGRQLDSAAAYTSKLKELEYTKIPQLYEEALLLYSFLTEKTPELFGFTVSRKSMESFERFCSILYSQHGGRADEALQDLSASFANSYFFYYVYGGSKSGAGNANQ